MNVSGWRDLDKSVDSYREYILGDYDKGVPYSTYFVNASKYFTTNYPEDEQRGLLQTSAATDGDTKIALDLEEDLRSDQARKFDVVFCHTVLEHVFDVFKAFENLCLMSKDIVIVVVPAVQRVHDYGGDYSDYWRFTPFALDKLFEENGFGILYRSSSALFQSSIYYFYIASREPDKWKSHFELVPLTDQIGELNTGDKVFPLANVHLRFEQSLRKFARLLGLRE